MKRKLRTITNSRSFCIYENVDRRDRHISRFLSIASLLPISFALAGTNGRAQRRWKNSSNEIVFHLFGESYKWVIAIFVIPIVDLGMDC